MAELRKDTNSLPSKKTMLFAFLSAPFLGAQVGSPAGQARPCLPLRRLCNFLKMPGVPLSSLFEPGRWDLVFLGRAVKDLRARDTMGGQKQHSKACD